MDYKYLLRPLEHGIATQYPSVGIPGSFSPATKNSKVWKHSIKKRWGYTQDRDLGRGVIGLGSEMFQQYDGERHTLLFTDKDICKRESNGSNTFSYLTPTYTTGTISDITGAVVTGVDTVWTVALEGMPFILDSDHSSLLEPDANWATIATVSSATSLTLSSAYTGTTGAFSPAKSYKIRQQFGVLSSERWRTVSVDEYFVATNGTAYAQKWDGSWSTTQTIDATYCSGAHYCAAFADRLFLADMVDEATGVRNPFLLKWSTITDPMNFDYTTDTSAGRKEFLESDDFITGIARSGPYLVVFKRDAVYIGQRESDTTMPISFQTRRSGGGCRAPYSIVEAMGSCFWLGKDDFYTLYGDQATAIGENAAYKLYDVITETEAENVWGFLNDLDHEIVWVAPSSDGSAQYAFSWDYKYNEWNMYEFADFIKGAGRGAV